MKMKMTQKYEEGSETEKQSLEIELSQLLERTLLLEDELNHLIMRE